MAFGLLTPGLVESKPGSEPRETLARSWALLLPCRSLLGLLPETSVVMLCERGVPLIFITYAIQQLSRGHDWPCPIEQ